MEELYITFFENTNNFYGQCTGRAGLQQMSSFLDMLSEHCHRKANMRPMYETGNESHKGEICAVPGSRVGEGRQRYYRGKIVKEGRDNVDVLLLDVGGRERVAKTAVISLPPDILRKTELGIRCSLDHGNSVGDNKLKNMFMNNFLEVRKVKKMGDYCIVVLTNNNDNRRLRNADVMRYLADKMEGVNSDKLNSLVDRQNNRRDELIERSGNSRRGDSFGRGDNRKQETFARGDLRNSLREKRAAREAANNVSQVVYSYPNIGVGLKAKGKITWMYSPDNFYMQVPVLSLHLNMADMLVAWYY